MGVHTVRGDLAEFSVSDLLQLYQIAAKTGSLAIASDRGRTTLYFDRGQVIGVGADGWSLLTELSRIVLLPPEVRQQIEVLPRDGEVAGLNPIARALVMPQVWEQFVDLQLERLIFPLVGLTEGEFIAEVRATPALGALRVDQAPQQLILRAARWDEELRRAEEQGFGRGSRWQRVDTRTSDESTGAILSLMEQPRTVDQLSVAAGKSILRIIDCLRYFARLGRVEQLS